MTYEKTLPNIRPAYIGIAIKNGDAAITFYTGKKIWTKKIITGKNSKAAETTSQFLKQQTRERKIKIIAAGIIGEVDPRHPMISTLWLKNDIVPFLMHRRGYSDKEESRVAAHEAKKKFDTNYLPRIPISRSQQVSVAEFVRLDDYKRTSKHANFEKAISLARQFEKRGGKLLFINSTPSGGGVAIMRHGLIRLYKLLGVQASWYVLAGSNQEIFNTTKKKFHNVLHGIAPVDIKLTAADIKLYEQWIDENAKILRPAILRANVIVIDDPQPSALIPYIKKINPGAKIIYRSHIQIEASLIKKQHEQQSATWNYLWQHIRLTDLFVSHPVRAFIPHNVPKRKLVLMPATTDRLDGLNKKLSSRQTSYYIQLFNDILKDNGQTPLSPQRPYIIQVARFDPSKGILDVIEAYRHLRVLMEKQKIQKRKIPQLVIVGHGSVDDPEGIPIFAETMHLLSMYRNRKYAHDIKVARLPNSDQILNALLSNSKIALQLSYKEGFEIKVTEAIAKGIPVIVYKTGGIPLQVRDKKNGFLVNTGDTYDVAHLLLKLLTDKKLYKKMSAYCLANINADFFTVANASKWLYLAYELLTKKTVNGNGQLLTMKSIPKYQTRE